MALAGITAFHKRNLAKLADYLDALPASYKHFKMKVYFEQRDDHGRIEEVDLGRADPKRILNCGTAACAIGHAPLAGIKPKRGEEWDDYELRVFGMSIYGPHEDQWANLFGSENPNSAKAAAKRIRKFLGQWA